MGCHVGSGVAVGPAEAHEQRRTLASAGSEVVAPSTGVSISRPRAAPCAPPAAARGPPLPESRPPPQPQQQKPRPAPPLILKARRPAEEEEEEESTLSSGPEPLVATPPTNPSASRFGPRAAALREASKRAGAQTARKRRQLSMEAPPAPSHPSPTSVIAPEGASSTKVSARSPESTVKSAEGTRCSGAQKRGPLDAKRQGRRMSRNEQIELALAQVRDVSDLVSRLQRDAGEPARRDACCAA